MSKISNRVVGTLSTSSGSIRATAAGVSNTWLGVDGGGCYLKLRSHVFPARFWLLMPKIGTREERKVAFETRQLQLKEQKLMMPGMFHGLCKDDSTTR